MSYRQFIASEGGKITKAAIIGASIANTGSCGSIRHDINSLKKTTSCSKVKSKFRHFALDHHPDKNGNAIDFNDLVEARDNALTSCKPRVQTSTKKGNKQRKKHKKHKKKEKKKKKKKKKERKEREEDDLSFGQMIAGGVIAAGVVSVIKKKSHPQKPRLRRQLSGEAYLKATGHKRRE